MKEEKQMTHVAPGRPILAVRSDGAHGNVVARALERAHGAQRHALDGTHRLVRLELEAVRRGAKGRVRSRCE